MADLADEMRVLAVPATSADGSAISKLLTFNELDCVVLPNVVALCETMRNGVGSVVLAEEALLADAGMLIECIRAQQVWSDLPIIVLAPAGRESVALAQLLSQLGNVTVIERPVRTTTLVSLLRSSLRARSRQYQVREHLAQQENAQRVIREAEQRFRLLVENITDYAIFMIDAEGRVASWNSGAQNLLGYSADEILGQPTTRFFLTAEHDLLAREMKEARLAGRATSTGWRVRKNAQHMFMEGVLTPVRDDWGRLLGYSKLMRDVTDKRRTEIEREQLLQSERAARGEAERSSRMKDEFLATLGHELRTPLNAILGWSQVLSRVNGATTEIAEGLRVIERNARAQAQIIDDLLDMSSIISGKVRLAMQRVDLGSVVETSIKAVRPSAEAKGIDLHVSVDALDHSVTGDPNRLQQVFWNLLTNAVKFTPKSGQVSVTVERVNSHLDVTITDNGEGIDAAFLPHVFERFRQADASTARRHGGLGLGLSVVKQLVELHGGSVSATSGGRGMGATFRIGLPLMASEGHARADVQQPEPPLRSVPSEDDVQLVDVDLEGVKVLVVDDEPDARSLVERLLHDCAATVTTAASASEAFAQLLRDRPDVLVSDIGMPSEDGYALIRRIRKLHGDRGSVPAIALTAYARAEDRATALEAGYQSHLAKPVEPGKLVSMVAQLGKRLPAALRARPH
jgi:PAS domain S-box-containing protein